MSSLQQPIKKIKITTDHHITRSLLDTAGGSPGSASVVSASSLSSSYNSNIAESIQILNLVNSVELFRDFTLSKAIDILLTAQKLNFKLGSVVIDLENNSPSNALYIVVNGKISCTNRSGPPSPKSSDSEPNPFDSPSTSSQLNEQIFQQNNKNLNTIKKRKRENSFLKQQLEQHQQHHQQHHHHEQLCSIHKHDNTNIYRINEENEIIDEFEDDQQLQPHCCFQSGDHFCENSYPSNLFIAETDVEVIKFNKNSLLY